MRVPFARVKPAATESDFKYLIWAWVSDRLFAYTRFLSRALNGPPPTRHVGFRTIGTTPRSDEFKRFLRNEGGESNGRPLAPHGLSAWRPGQEPIDQRPDLRRCGRRRPAAGGATGETATGGG